MDLQIDTFPVRRLSAGTPAGWSDGILTIDPDAVRDLVLEDDRIRRVAIDLVAPGDDERIILMRDVIEPRIKIEGRGHVYPGVAAQPPAAARARRSLLPRGGSVCTRPGWLPP